MMPWILIPFALQGLVMGFDEFYFHQRRTLPAWERWGHPLDTVTVLFPLLLVFFVPYSDRMALIFLWLALVSCASVTKDEWVHANFCVPGEHWVHSLLFLLHPLIFGSMFLLWREPGGRVWLALELALLIPFLAYQTLYWNVYKARQH